MLAEVHSTGLVALEKSKPQTVSPVRGIARRKHRYIWRALE